MVTSWWPKQWVIAPVCAPMRCTTSTMGLSGWQMGLRRAACFATAGKCRQRQGGGRGRVRERGRGVVSDAELRGCGGSRRPRNDGRGRPQRDMWGRRATKSNKNQSKIGVYESLLSFANCQQITAKFNYLHLRQIVMCPI